MERIRSVIIGCLLSFCLLISTIFPQSVHAGFFNSISPRSLLSSVSAGISDFFTSIADHLSHQIVSNAQPAAASLAQLTEQKYLETETALFITPPSTPPIAPPLGLVTTSPTSIVSSADLESALAALAAQLQYSIPIQVGTQVSRTPLSSEYVTWNSFDRQIDALFDSISRSRDDSDDDSDDVVLDVDLADVIGTLSVTQGGTGLTSAPTYGQLLVGNSSGGYTLTATSSLGITSGGSGTVNSGASGYFAYYPSSGTTVDDQTVLNISGSNIGIGTTSPYAKLSVVGQAVATTFTGSSFNATTSTGYQIGGVTVLTDSDSLNNLLVGLNAGNSTMTGNSNTFIGGGAGSANTDGAENIFIGLNTGSANDTGSTNVFVGNLTASSNESGSNSVAIGQQALEGNSTGSSLTAVGAYAGGAFNMGDLNTFLGYSANTSGSTITNATAIGANAIVSRSNSVVLGSSANVGIGTSSPFAKLSVGGDSYLGGNVTATGTFAVQGTGTSTFAGGLTATNLSLSGYYLTINGTSTIIATGTRNFYAFGATPTTTAALSGNGTNLFLGNSSGNNNTTGRFNTYMGAGAGTLNTTGNFNVGFGFNGGGSNTTGSTNTFIHGGGSNTTGSQNVFIGASSGAFNSTGSDNVYIGTLAGQLVSVTTGNVIVGANAGSFGDSGGAVILGYKALNQSLGFASTTAVGYQSGFGAFGTSANNALFGYQSGFALTSGSNNTLLGYQAGDTITTGSTNTIIGYLADASAGLSNASAIGANASVAASNSMSLGGTGANAVKIGIGTTTPWALLSVNQTVGTIGFAVGSSTATNFVVAANNNVGIGTSSPAARLSLTQTVNDNTGGFFIAASDADSRAIYMDTSGALHFVGGGSASTDATLAADGTWTNGSDRAFKKNIVDLPYGLKEVLELQPRSYISKSTGDTRIGFVAQEVQDVIPEVVFGQEGSMSIAYGNLAALSIKGTQDIAELLGVRASSTASSKLTAVRLDDIESRISALEQKSLLASAFSSVTEWVGSKITATLALFDRADIGEVNAGRINVEKGITITDKKTGELYCITLEDGDMKTDKGSCKDLEVQEDEHESDNSNDQDEDAASEQESETEDTSTTTPETQETSESEPATSHPESETVSESPQETNPAPADASAPEASQEQ